MQTNHNGHTFDLTKRVMAVIDDARNAQAAVETLERAGVEERELAILSGRHGIRQIDAEGLYGGGIRRAFRLLQRLTVESDHLREYEAQVARGHHVVNVRVHRRAERDAVIQILRGHGAHFINVYGPWMVESVAA